MIKISLVCVMALVIMVGCVQTSALPSVSQNLTETPQITPTLPTETLAPKETVAVTLPVSSSSPLSKCLTIESNYSVNSLSTGILVLSGIEDIGNNLVRYTAYKINMETNEKLEFSNSGKNILYVSISPDRKWIAYKKYILDSKSGNLIITDSLGKQQKIIPWENEWGNISSWLDSKRLLMDVDTISNSDTSIASRSSTFLVLNPFTNERHMLQPDFPNIFESQGFNGLVGTAYNPKLDQVVYLQGDPSFSEPLHYVLWDIDRQRSLVSFEVVIQPTALPSWSPDGGKFALAASLKEDILQTWPAYELYSVSRDGQVTQLTHLTDYYPWVYIDNYSWSPDGKHIAFWFSSWSKEKPDYELQTERYLAIVDIENKTVTNYCMQGKLGDSGRVALPVWSPNGKQLVVESPSSEGHTQVVLIDLDRQIALKLSEDMKPEGWMVAP